jgi:dethiobiotin synthetase
MVLVVGMTSGCIASALACAKAFTDHGLECAGWVANESDPAWKDSKDAFESIRAALPAPCLGSIPRLADGTVAVASRRIDVRRVLLALAR